MKKLRTTVAVTMSVVIAVVCCRMTGEATGLTHSPPPDFVKTARQEVLGYQNECACTGDCVNSCLSNYFIAGMSDLKNVGGYRHTSTKVVHPASTFKVFVMEYAYLQVHAGNVSLDTMVEGKTLKQRVDSMIQYSDNLSTTAIINYFGVKNINNWLAKEYTVARIYKWYGVLEGPRLNETCVEDILCFLEKVFKNRKESPYDLMYQTMVGNKVTSKIPKSLKEFSNVRVANKTGSFNQQGFIVDHDIAIVVQLDEKNHVEFAYAIVILTQFVGYKNYWVERSNIIAISKNIFGQVSEYVKNTKEGAIP